LAIVWLCWVYDATNNLAPLRKAAAYSDARSVLHLETIFHLDPERTLVHWLSHHATLALLISDYYDNAHFVVTLGLLGLLWWKFPELYRPLRTGLVLTNVIAMAVFWLFPTAPPRLLDPSAYPDLVARSGAFGSWHSGTLGSAANQFAAMPSLHIAWAVWSALALWRILARRTWALVVWVYPMVTAVAVLSTGNHFLLDVIGGVVTLVLSMFISERWQNWWTSRQASWALRTRREASANSLG
jgi:hypothetical protein